jgi:hypothetical protein
MRRAGQHAVRFLALVALAVVVSFALNDAPDAVTPYASALSSAAVAPALAAPSCPFKTCAKEPGRGANCVKSLNPYRCELSSQGGCFPVAC